MVDLAKIQSFHDKTFDELSEPIDLLENTGAAFITHPGLRGISKSYTADELVGTITQDDMKMLILPADLTGAVAPIPKEGDRITWRGNQLAVMSVDKSTRSIQGTVLTYVLRVRG